MRYLNEEFIHRFYPNWDLSKMHDSQVLAIAYRLKNKPPAQETPSNTTCAAEPQYHQMTISEYLGGLK